MTEVIRIENYNNYEKKIIDNTLILTPKKRNVTEDELKKINLTSSKIKQCIVKKESENITNKTNYKKIVVDIWKTMKTKNILQNTTFNYELENKHGEKGYVWCEDIKVSFQGKDANSTFKEILKMVKINKMNIYISIELKTGENIYYENN